MTARITARPAPATELLARLREAYPGADCSLEHADACQLLVSTILSAQCTDARVNAVTPALFHRFPDAAAMAGAGTELEELIRSTGFFNAKAKSIRGACRAIVDQHGGLVPGTMEGLHALPGVGRKTANVVLGTVWGNPDGVVVDTHVGRLARRLGWSCHADPVKVENDLNALLPRSTWVFVGHALILHGRRVCSSRSPRCGSCPVSDLCPKVGVVSTAPAPLRPAARADWATPRKRSPKEPKTPARNSRATTGRRGR
ncbi:MAG: endonuclease III [Deltaproteobacteria bacterium]|nr:endonuclease III [Deltaproteobacteria bacterium]